MTHDLIVRFRIYRILFVPLKFGSNDLIYNLSIKKSKPEEENYQPKITYDVKLNLTQIISLEETSFMNQQDLNINR